MVMDDHGIYVSAEITKCNIENETHSQTELNKSTVSPSPNESLLVLPVNTQGLAKITPVSSPPAPSVTSNSPKNRVVPNQRKVRKNGFSYPPNPSQVISWVIAAFILFSFVLITTAILLKDNLTMETRIVVVALSILYAPSYLSMIILTAIVTANDPTDPVVHFERLVKSQKDVDSRDGLKLINQNCHFYCFVCKSHVAEGSKHCQSCNRCTNGFDHHCRWVANDINSSNYANFIRMLIVTMATLAL